MTVTVSLYMCYWQSFSVKMLDWILALFFCVVIDLDKVQTSSLDRKSLLGKGFITQSWPWELFFPWGKMQGISSKQEIRPSCPFWWSTGTQDPLLSCSQSQPNSMTFHINLEYWIFILQYLQIGALSSEFWIQITDLMQLPGLTTEIYFPYMWMVLP